MTNANGVVQRFPAAAINCYTGSLVTVAGINGRDTNEAEILERGDGYLLRAGLDEWGFPEITFDVVECGIRGMAAVGCSVRADTLNVDDPISQLRDLVDRYGGAVAWVNSSYLTYADVYADSPGYLHAVLVTGVSSDLAEVCIHDSLVVDRERHGCVATMAAADFRNAVTDRVSSESFDLMGYFHIVESVSEPMGRRDVMVDLRRQATSFFTEDRFRFAVSNYHMLCAEKLDREDALAVSSARRIFDHVNVLYVVPSLALFRRSLLVGCFESDALVLMDELVELWRAMAVLALKFEATSSTIVRKRIDIRFDEIAKSTERLWKAVST